MPEAATSQLMSVSSRCVVVIIRTTGIEGRGGAARRRKVIKFVKGPPISFIWEEEAEDPLAEGQGREGIEKRYHRWKAC
jgi:hypothetical protein